MLKAALDKYTLLCCMSILVVDMILYIAKYFPHEYNLFFYFAGLIAYVIGAYFMFKEMNFDNLPLPVSLIRFFQLILPSTELIRVGLLFFVE